MIQKPSTRIDSIRTNRRRVLQAFAMIPAAGIGLVAIGNAASQDDSDVTPEAGGQATPQASPIAITDVYMTPQLRFDPEEITIPLGGTVKWINATAMPHTATGDPDQNPVLATNPEYVVLPDGAEPWGSELLQPGDEFEHTFTVAGRYDYFCIPHVLSGMRGSVIVEEGE